MTHILLPGIVIARNEMTKQSKQYYVYIMTNKNNTVLYTGVTNNLKRRIYEHKAKLVDGFTKRYNVSKLVLIPPEKTGHEVNRT